MKYKVSMMAVLSVLLSGCYVAEVPVGYQDVYADAPTVSTPIYAENPYIVQEAPQVVYTGAQPSVVYIDDEPDIIYTPSPWYFSYSYHSYHHPRYHHHHRPAPVHHFHGGNHHGGPHGGGHGGHRGGSHGGHGGSHGGHGGHHKK